jgi:hypothetical protein
VGALGKDLLVERLRNALQAALREVKTDPNFAPKVVNTICTELGMDSLAALYLSGKLKAIIIKASQSDRPEEP